MLREAVLVANVDAEHPMALGKVPVQVSSLEVTQQR